MFNSSGAAARVLGKTPPRTGGLQCERFGLDVGEVQRLARRVRPRPVVAPPLAFHQAAVFGGINEVAIVQALAVGAVHFELDLVPARLEKPSAIQVDVAVRFEERGEGAHPVHRAGDVVVHGAHVFVKTAVVVRNIQVAPERRHNVADVAWAHEFFQIAPPKPKTDVRRRRF
uniref:Uncharacterized protein n=1 Tax=Marseillevirus LCMAC103 TaxID=2506604 RepID=A0A481YWN3_9VIRU|nr:MAG: hypothetical protein LCMAC103_02760 [Marseillevirus LCMAC103]